MAYREVYGDPLERIIETLKIGFASICQTWGAEIEPDDFEVIEARRELREKSATDRQVAATLTPTLGPPKRGNLIRRPRNPTKRPNDGV